MNPLDQEQQRLKAEWDARKAKHPFPGGWRENTHPTELEKTWRDFRGSREHSTFQEMAKLRGAGYLYPECIEAPARLATRSGYQLPIGRHVSHLVRDGRLYASRGWALKNIFVTRPGLTHSNLFCPDIERVQTDYNFFLYDVAQLITRFNAMKKSRLSAKLVVSVARVLQGSGSINDKLLAFVENGAE